MNSSNANEHVDLLRDGECLLSLFCYHRSREIRFKRGEREREILRGLPTFLPGKFFWESLRGGER